MSDREVPRGVDESLPTVVLATTQSSSGDGTQDLDFWSRPAELQFDRTDDDQNQVWSTRRVFNKLHRIERVKDL
jgi:hypothetical protein